MRQVLERRSDLIDLLHARTERAAAYECHDIARLHGTVLQSRDSIRFPREYPCPALLAVDPIRIDHRGVYRRALDNSTIGSQVAAAKRDRASQTAPTGCFGSVDDLVRINSVHLAQPVAADRPPLANAPLVEGLTERDARCGQRFEIQHSHVAQMQHHLGNAASEEHAHGGVADRTVRQHVYHANDASVHLGPVVDSRAVEASAIRYRRQMQQQIRRSAERGMHDHRIAKRPRGEDIPGDYASGALRHRGACRPSRGILPDSLTRRCESRVGQS